MKNIVTIYLGNRCNLNCTYCHREGEAEFSVSLFLLECLQELSTKPEGLCIKFIGGEPTLYMQEISTVVKAVPHAEYCITTNGILLEQYADFFKRHKFKIVISYDGENGNLKRGIDPLKNSLEDYSSVSISTTICKDNYDLTQLIKDFNIKSKITNRKLLLFPHLIHITNEGNTALMMSESGIKKYTEEFKSKVELFINAYLTYGIINEKLLGLFYFLAKRYAAGYEYGETYCVNKSLKKVDLSGRLFPCLYIRNQELSIENWQQEQKKIISERFPACKECEVYFMCGAGCIMSQGHQLDCVFYKKIFTWFKEVVDNDERLIRFCQQCQY